jgi:hypothetical protein
VTDVTGVKSAVGTGHALPMREQDFRDLVRSEWSTRFARTVADELRAGVASGALNWSEAEQLLSRLRVLVDQGLDRTPQFG